MKSIVTFLVCLFLFAGKSIKAQECAGLTTEIIGVQPQSGSYNFWGVKVILAQIHDQDVTITGTIREEGGGTSQPFTLVVTAGNLTAETENTFFRACPACNAEVMVSSVTSCPDRASSGIGQIIKNLNYATLQSLVNTNDEQGIKNFFYPAANQIADYIFTNYNQDLRDSIQDQPEVMIAVGLLLHAKELGLPVSVFDDSSSTTLMVSGNKQLLLSCLMPSLINKVEWGACLKSALGSLLGYRNAKAVYDDLINMGLNVNTAFSAVKVIAKRAAWSITAGMVILEYMDCMDWI